MIRVRKSMHSKIEMVAYNHHIKILKQVIHPGVRRLIDYFESETSLWMAMESTTFISLEAI